MYCANCGAEVASSSNFCGSCGKTLAQGQEGAGGSPQGGTARAEAHVEEQRVRGFMGVEHVFHELKMLKFSTLFPVADWIKDKPWELLWVRWFCALALFPLFMHFFAAQAQLEFRNIAFIFGIYFAVIWGIVIYSIVKPSRSVRADLVKVGAFTAFVGTVIVLVVQRFPLISSFYNAASASVFSVQLIGFFGVALVEESTKALPILWIYMRGRKQDSVRTIMFLGCVSGLGFGVSEAVGYSIGYALNLINGQMGFGEYLIAQFTRLITLPFLHAMWAGICAYFIALGVQNRKLQKGLFVVGLGLAAILHGLYDPFSASYVGLAIAALAILLFVAYIRDEEPMEARIREIE